MSSAIMHHNKEIFPNLEAFLPYSQVYIVLYYTSWNRTIIINVIMQNIYRKCFLGVWELALDVAVNNDPKLSAGPSYGQRAQNAQAASSYQGRKRNHPPYLTSVVTNPPHDLTEPSRNGLKGRQEGGFEQLPDDRIRAN
jgi:hypothetical protein